MSNTQSQGQIIIKDNPADTVYFTPYSGNKFPVWESDSKTWSVRDFTEIVIPIGAVPDALFDVFNKFVEVDGQTRLVSMTRQWEFSSKESASRRGYEMELVEGEYTLISDPSGPGWVYVGTFMTQGDGRLFVSASRQMIFNFNMSPADRDRFFIYEIMDGLIKGGLFDGEGTGESVDGNK